MGFRVLAEGLGSPEGPVFTDRDTVVVTSMDRGHLYEVHQTGRVRRLVNTGGSPNGLTSDAEQLLYVAQNGGYGPWHRSPSLTGGIQVFAPDGRLVWLSQDPISPNDLCFGPDGYLYVTDPTRRPARDDGRLWRIHPITGQAELLRSVGWYPNGIAFGVSDEHLFVASTGSSQIIRFDVTHGVLTNETVMIDMPYGHPDGFAVDDEGNILIAAIGPESDPKGPGQLQVWSPSGELLETLEPTTSHYLTNVALSQSRQLVLTDSDRGMVLAFDNWPTKGLPLRSPSLPGDMN